MRYLVLDIETLPHPDANQWLEAVTCDPALLEPIKRNARLRDPAKIVADDLRVQQAEAERPELIAASIAQRTAERDDKLGLDPDCCQMCAIGWHVVGGADPTCLIATNEAEEADALTQLALAYTAEIGQQETRLVTFYGRQFDLPVLMRRAMYLGVKFPALNLDRYRSPHIDVWDAMTYNGALRTAHSLKFYAKRMGFGTLDKVDGGDVATLAKAGNWDAIREHCLSDVGLTHAVANRLGLLRVS